MTLRTNGGVSALSFIVRRVPDVVPRYLCKFDDAVHVSEHELGDVDCELTIDFRPLVPSLQRGEAELLLAFVEVQYKILTAVMRVRLPMRDKCLHVLPIFAPCVGVPWYS